MSSEEQEPLLDGRHKKPNPLPKTQLATVYAIKLTLPIALTQVLPYFNVLIEKLAASEGADTGYYSGAAVGHGDFLNFYTFIEPIKSSIHCSMARSLSACSFGGGFQVNSPFTTSTSSDLCGLLFIRR